MKQAVQKLSARPEVPAISLHSDWAGVEQHAGWLNNETDLPSDFSVKGRMIVAHSGIIADLNFDLKKAGLLEKPYNSWSEVSFGARRDLQGGRSFLKRTDRGGAGVRPKMQ